MLLSQVLKIPFNVLMNKELDFSVVVDSGGMPSGHASFVTSLVISIGLTEGFSSVIFAFSFVVGAIVIYDAMGVRFESGEHAKVINIMLKKDKDDERLKAINLKEKVGHTPIESIAGVIVGLISALLFYLFFY